MGTEDRLREVGPDQGRRTRNGCICHAQGKGKGRNPVATARIAGTHAREAVGARKMRTCIATLCLILVALGPLPATAASEQTGSAAPPASSFEQLSRAAEQARNQNHDDEAIALYQRALKLRPEWDEGLWNLCSLLYEKEKYPEARDDLRRFVADQPKAGMGWALLGLSEFRTREYARALDHLRQAMTLGTGGSKGMARSVFYYAAVLLTRFEMYDESQRLLFEMARSGQEESFLVEPLGLAALRMPLLPEEI